MKTADGSPRRAARVSISYVGFLTAPSAWSTTTRISLIAVLSLLPGCSDELLGGEEVGQRLGARALLVLDDLARLARRTRGGVLHLRPRHGQPHVAGVDPEVGQRQRLEGLL